ncbi:sialate O-acetylesterase [Pacificimonas sp. ICDLI1SI03]
MPTIVSHSIGAGRDYATLDAWSAAQARDLIALDEIAELVVYDAGISDSSVFNHGWTCDAVNRIIIRAADGLGHGGQAGTGVGFSHNGSYTFRPVAGAYVEVVGLAGSFSLAGDYGGVVHAIGCYMEGTPNRGVLTRAWITNCIIRNAAEDAVYTVTGGIRVRNCTIYNAGDDGLVVYGSGSEIYNTIVMGSGDNAIETDAARGGNITDDGTAGSLLVADPASLFVDAENGDFRLKDGATPAAGAGLTLADVSTDMEGKLRGDPPDAGAYEYEAAAPAELDPPTLGVPTNIGEDRAELPFTLPAGADGIEITIGGLPVDYSGASPFAATDLSPGTVYGWSARAYDADGDIYSSPVSGAEFTTDEIAAITVSYTAEYFPLIRCPAGAEAVDLTVSGTATGGAAGAVEYRLSDTDAGAAVAGHDWQPLGEISGGAFGGTISPIPPGGGRDPAGTYRVDVRLAEDVGVTASGATFGVGRTVVLSGQSNMQLWEATDHAPPPPLSVLAQTSLGGGGAAPVGEGHVAFANRFTQLTGVPVHMIRNASGGKPISYWDKSAGSGNQGYWDLIGKVDYRDANDPVCILWNQGEGNCGTGSGNPAAYRASLSALAGNLRADLNLPTLKFVAIPLIYASPATALGYRMVRQAQYEFQEDSPHNLTTAHSPDLFPLLRPDKLHLTSYRILAERAADFVAARLFGMDVQALGPRVAEVMPTAAGQTDVRIAHAGGNGVLPEAGATGFQLSVDGQAVAVENAVRIATDTVRLSHDPIMPGAARTVRYMAGTPDVSVPMMDDAGWALEPEYAGISGTAVPIAEIAPATARIELRSSGALLDHQSGVASVLPVGTRIRLRGRGAAVWPGGSAVPRARRGRTLRPQRNTRTRHVQE